MRNSCRRGMPPVGAATQPAMDAPGRHQTFGNPRRCRRGDCRPRCTPCMLVSPCIALYRCIAPCPACSVLRRRPEAAPRRRASPMYITAASWPHRARHGNRLCSARRTLRRRARSDVRWTATARPELPAAIGFCRGCRHRTRVRHVASRDGFSVESCPTTCSGTPFSSPGVEDDRAASRTRAVAASRVIHPPATRHQWRYACRRRTGRAALFAVVWRATTVLSESRCDWGRCTSLPCSTTSARRAATRGRR